jgi:hypothetical protein
MGSSAIGEKSGVFWEFFEVLESFREKGLNTPKIRFTKQKGGER